MWNYLIAKEEAASNSLTDHNKIVLVSTLLDQSAAMWYEQIMADYVEYQQMAGQAQKQGQPVLAYTSPLLDLDTFLSAFLQQFEDQRHRTHQALQEELEVCYLQQGQRPRQWREDHLDWPSLQSTTGNSSSHHQSSGANNNTSRSTGALQQQQQPSRNANQWHLRNGNWRPWGAPAQQPRTPTPAANTGVVPIDINAANAAMRLFGGSTAGIG
ncbi:unnamed protein product [Peniophora sp. CBMAI 1063]|nr:unnamed protein product [Peniophora sp. CBMAI 1063]